MKVTALVLAGLAAMSAAASYANPPMVEEDSYPRGSLGVAAIERGDWKTAEVLLTAPHSGIAQDDPARLINLGRVYMATGRTSQALSAWQAAAASSHPYEIEMGDGRVYWSSKLANQLIARYQPMLHATASN